MLRFTNVDPQLAHLPPVYGYRTHPLLPLRQALAPILSRIDHLDGFIKIANDECHYPSEHGLSRDESASIYLYTMDWGEQSLYRVLNKALRVEDRSTLVPWHGYLKLLDTALETLPSLRMNLWRGVNGDVSKKFAEGIKLTWWSFNSCTSAIKVIKTFLGPVSTLFMIEAKNGKDISAYSNFPKEKEVILGLGTRLLVASDVLDHLSLNIVHLVELSDESGEELSPYVTTMNATAARNSIARVSANEEDRTFKVYTYADGGKYEGEWVNGKRHGKGTYYYLDGTTYMGGWIDDQKSGPGVFTWPNGDRYEIRCSQMS